MFFPSLLAAILLLGTPVADAGTTVMVVVDPFSPAYVPEPRADLMWVAGFYDPYGVYTPGYWRPIAGRPGFLWVGGYWVGSAYHPGYWRPSARAGHGWIEGYYLGGRYVPGRWVAGTEYEHVRAQTRAERASHASSRHAPSRHEASTSRSASPSSSHGKSGSHGKKGSHDRAHGSKRDRR